MNSIDNGFFPRVSRAFALLPVAILIAFLRNVIEMMTDNPAFVTPPPFPTLLVMGAAVDDLEVKNQLAMNRGRVEIANRRVAEAVAINLGRQLGNYVESQANGRLDVLLSSGFEAVRAPSPSTVPATPRNPVLVLTGVTCELLLRFIGDANARSYSIQYAENATGPWTERGLVSSTRVTLIGLTPGTIYWVRACAHGAAGTSDWCSPASLMAV